MALVRTARAGYPDRMKMFLLLAALAASARAAPPAPAADETARNRRALEQLTHLSETSSFTPPPREDALVLTLPRAPASSFDLRAESEAKLAGRSPAVTSYGPKATALNLDAKAGNPLNFDVGPNSRLKLGRVIRLSVSF